MYNIINNNKYLIDELDYQIEKETDAKNDEKPKDKPADSVMNQNNSLTEDRHLESSNLSIGRTQKLFSVIDSSGSF